MRQKGFGFTHESTYNESVEWYTPPLIFDALGVTFDLDPCSPLAGPIPWIPAKRHLTIADDGLNSEWGGGVWMNPPYGKHTAAWMARLAEHGNGIGLVFARTDTAWFHDVVERASVVLFIRKRLRFIPANKEQDGGGAGAGSMLVAFGELYGQALRRSGLGVPMQALSEVA